MTDVEGLTTTYTYDALGRVIAETKSGGGVRSDTTTTTTYDLVRVQGQTWLPQ